MHTQTSEQELWRLARGSRGTDLWSVTDALPCLCTILSRNIAHTTTTLQHTLVHQLSLLPRTGFRKRTTPFSTENKAVPQSLRPHHPHLATHTSLPNMSTAARRRLMRDFKRMQTDPPAGVSASPIADNVMTWYGPNRKHLRRLKLVTNLRPQERCNHRTLRHTF